MDRSQERHADFGEVYRVLDGRMDGCAAGACSNSCCASKYEQLPNGQRSDYSASFRSPELFYQLNNGLLPLSLADRRELNSLHYVNVASGELAGLELRRSFPGGRRGGERPIYGVNGCFNQGDGSCRLPVKPLVCRLYPFLFGHEVPIIYPGGPGFGAGCPHALDIARQNPDVIRAILEVRKMFRYKQSKEWLENLMKIISS